MTSHAINRYRDDDTDCDTPWSPSALRACTEGVMDDEQEELVPLANYTAATIVSTHPDLLPYILRCIDSDALLWRLRRVCSHWSRTVLRVFGEENGFTGYPRCVSLCMSRASSYATALATSTRTIERYAPFVASNNVRALELYSSAAEVLLSPVSSFASTLRRLTLIDCEIPTVSLLSLRALETLDVCMSSTFRVEYSVKNKRVYNELAQSLRHFSTDSDTPCKILKRFTRLHSLMLTGPNFTARSVDAVLAKLTDLRMLDIRKSDAELRGHGLASTPHLHTLRCNIQYDSLSSHLGACTTLTELDVDARDAASPSCERFIAHVTVLTNLTNLTLRGLYPHLDVKQLTALTSLTRLFLQSMPHTNCNFVRSLTRLKSLHLAYSNARSVFAAPSPTLPLLQELQIIDSFEDELYVLGVVSDFPSLRRVATTQGVASKELCSRFTWICFIAL